MLDDKARKRQHAKEVMHEYEVREQRQRHILWGLFFAVMVFFLGCLAYGFLQPGRGTNDWTMPFIGERHRQLIENNPERAK